LVRLANRVLRWEGVNVEFLPAQHWVPWELAVAAAVGRTVRPVPGQAALELRFESGRPLSQILDAELPLDRKLNAVHLAAQALRKLHTISLRNEQAAKYPLSHGDATCQNVIIDLPESSATWIDFDMRHRGAVATGDRHADDLLTLLRSTACHLPASTYEECTRSLFAGYGDLPILLSVQERFSADRCPSIFHLAQAPLRRTAYLHLRRVIEEFPIEKPGFSVKSRVSAHGMPQDEND
jgi:hypothetical protein